MIMVHSLNSGVDYSNVELAKTTNIFMLELRRDN